MLPQDRPLQSSLCFRTTCGPAGRLLRHWPILTGGLARYSVAGSPLMILNVSIPASIVGPAGPVSLRISSSSRLLIGRQSIIGAIVDRQLSVWSSLSGVM